LVSSASASTAATTPQHGRPGRWELAGVYDRFWGSVAGGLVARPQAARDHDDRRQKLSPAEKVWPHFFLSPFYFLPCPLPSLSNLALACRCGIFLRASASSSPSTRADLLPICKCTPWAIRSGARPSRSRSALAGAPQPMRLRFLRRDEERGVRNDKGLAVAIPTVAKYTRTGRPEKSKSVALAGALRPMRLRFLRRDERRGVRNDKGELGFPPLRGTRGWADRRSQNPPRWLALYDR